MLWKSTYLDEEKQQQQGVPPASVWVKVCVSFCLIMSNEMELYYRYYTLVCSLIVQSFRSE